ncbi:MAG: 2-octaprenyl-6-methoxyphenyl hydroxylase [Ectothiorhodospiraceae bacterium]
MSGASLGADVVIAGAGLVGTSLALALGDSGLQVRIVDPAPPAAAQQPGYDDRSTALAPASRRILEGLGVWPAIASEAAPIRTIHVSEQGSFGMTRLQAAREGLDALGWVVPNRVLGGALQARLTPLSPAVATLGAGVTDVATAPEGAQVSLDNGDTMTTRLVVAADGTHSVLREQLGLSQRVDDYHQQALVANVTPARNPAGLAFERFTPDGPLAVLPLTGGRCALVWTAPAERAETLAALPDAAFLEALQAAFGYRLGRFLAVGRRSVYPLGLRRSEQRVTERGVVIGNAARTLHPVAGQGLNLALRDVAELAERLHAVGRRDGDPGAADVLAGYSDARAGDHRRVTVFTDGLVRLFSNRLPGLRLARNLGLVGMELMPAAREQLMHRAMGRFGRLPRLARGLPLEAPHG